MQPVDFPGANAHSDGFKERISVPIRKELNTNDGLPYIRVAWQPSLQDLNAIVSGRPIMMIVQATEFPPVMLYTNNDEDEPNV